MTNHRKTFSIHAKVNLVLAVWLIVVGLGVHSLMVYAYTAGPAAAAPASWIAERGVFPDGDRSLLVMFVHPHCPCSRASVSELAVVMAKANGALKARVYFYVPAGTTDGWERTDLWHAAAAIPGVAPLVDLDGRAARAFDAQVSGDTQVYGPDRLLAFSGGITPSRGHEGDSEGRRAIVAHLAHVPTPTRNTPAFGCYLFGSDAVSGS